MISSNDQVYILLQVTDICNKQFWNQMLERNLYLATCIKTTFLQKLLLQHSKMVALCYVICHCACVVFFN